MADNKLNLLVKFTGIDKLSGGLRNIIGASKTSTQSLRTMRQEVRENEKELKRVRDLLKGGSTSMGLVLAEESLSRAIVETNQKIDAQKRKLESVANIEKRFSGIASAAGKAGAAASLAVTAPLVAFGRSAFISAMDAEELRSAFNVTFGKSGAMMEAWAAKTGAAVGRTNVELMQAANTFGIFFNQADPKKSAAMSQQFAMLAQDLSSFYNVDPGTSLEKLRSGLTGESEPLRDFGVFMTEAAVKAQALKMGLKPIGGELTEQQKIMARAGLIMAQTTAAQGDLARTSGSTANQLRASEAAWQNMSLIVGQQLIPALTPLIQTFSGIIQQFALLSPETRKWIVIAGGIAAVVGPILVGVASIAGAIATLAPILAGAGAGVAIFAGVWLPLAAVIGYAAYQIYSNWDGISAWFSAKWQAISGAFTAGVAAVKGIVGGLPGWLTSIGRAMMEGLLMSINPMALAVKLIAMAKTGVQAFKNYLGIKSPSRLMMEMGGHVATGLGMGLDQGRRQPVRAMGRMAGAVAGAGAMALAPAAAQGPAAAPPARKIEIHVHQQPGENANALAERVARLVDRAERGKRLRGMEDDF